MAGLGHHLRNFASIMAFTVAVTCCILLVFVTYNLSPWSDASKRPFSFSENKRSNDVPWVFKRTVVPSNRFHYYENCILATPSKEDIHKLCTEQECGTVHCVQSCPCGDNKCHVSSKTTCFIKACMKFRVKLGQAVNEVSLERLSEIVNDDIVTLQDRQTVEVTCSDRNSHLLDRKLDLEISRNDLGVCTLDGFKQLKHTNTSVDFHPANQTKTDVYLVYFRLMSKWESFAKLPRLNSLIEHTRKNVLWNLLSFDEVQSHSLMLDENLREVLGVPDFSQNINKTEDLIQLAFQDGQCVFFHALACHRSGIYRDIQEIVQDGNVGECRLQQNKHPETRKNADYNNHTFCDHNNMDMDMEDVLYVHDRIGQIYSTTETNSFSIVVINIPDLKSTEVFDTAITGMVERVLSRESNILILMSDVGDPKFSRFDESIFLRTQVFNPLLHVFISSRTALARPVISLFMSEINMKVPKPTLGMATVHAMIHTVLLGHETKEATQNPDAPITDETSRNMGQVGSLNTLCPVARDHGPVECVCLGKHVRFPNDSLQAAFAGFIVGNLNNKLLELSSLNNIRTDRKLSEGRNHTDKHTDKHMLGNRFACDRLRGLYFNDVQHVLWKSSTFILMTMYLRPTTRLHSPTIRLDAEVEYTTDDSYNTNFTINILHPTKIPLTDLSDTTSRNFRKLFTLLCRDASDLLAEPPGHRQFLHSISSEISFQAKAETKCLHYPCLYLLTWSRGDSSDLEAANVCSDRTYNLTASVDYVNILPMAAIPTDITVGAREVKYISSLVKNRYWLFLSGYKVHTSYVVTML